MWEHECCRQTDDVTVISEQIYETVQYYSASMVTLPTVLYFRQQLCNNGSVNFSHQLLIHNHQYESSALIWVICFDLMAANVSHLLLSHFLPWAARFHWYLCLMFGNNISVYFFKKYIILWQVPAWLKLKITSSPIDNDWGLTMIT